MNVADMEYRDWVSLATSCDAYVADVEKRAAEAHH